jgi:hypothetical protein
VATTITSVQVEPVRDGVVEVAGQGLRRRDRHPALQHHLHGSEAAGGVQAVHVPAQAFGEGRMPEEPVGVGSDAARLETGDQRVADEHRAAAHPLHAALDAGQPVPAHPVELFLGAEQRATAAAVRRDHEPVAERHGADPDGREDTFGGGGHRAPWLSRLSGPDTWVAACSP